MLTMEAVKLTRTGGSREVLPEPLLVLCDSMRTKLVYASEGEKISSVEMSLTAILIWKVCEVRIRTLISYWYVDYWFTNHKNLLRNGFTEKKK